MFKKALGLLGMGSAPAAAAATTPPYQPYPPASSANAIYDLLFCDAPTAYRGSVDRPADWQDLLFGASQDPAKIADLARDTTAESRVRALAYNWLRAHGQPAPKGAVLGVVVEMPFQHGLDVLAAYEDGGVRYINQSGKLVFVEPGALPKVNQLAKHLLALAQPIVARIGPWDKARLPPPKRPDVRITFIVSDGLYFGQGPAEVMQRDALAGPLLLQGAQLTKAVIDSAVAGQN